jgi:hypothetical protein
MHALDDLVMDRPIRVAPQARQAKQFALWPVPPSSLEALVELGMSNEALARYFKVRVDAVARLRRECGIN